MTGQRNTSHEHRAYLPAMGKQWLLPLYDPFARFVGIKRVHEKLLDRANIRPGQRVLEIGCGTGDLLQTLKRRYPDVSALGIDPDPSALRRARRKAARTKLRIQYERAFADDLPLPDGSFDRVLSSFMLHHIDEEEWTRVLREVKRVLRPGGELHVADLDGTLPGQEGGHAHHSGQTADSLPERALSALVDAGLTGVRENGYGRARLGRYVFYRADVG
ncbi:class I SAM-dependent methyltransferase [Salinispora arenicola]|uniref:class I SAM-dependent methyltransferase n=1 Tax=Salinispora arenicola TaxID=168697 RepID=UPI00039C303B|nr:class I SAM-dependent methyltransferase [Salinispora arenicola]